MRYKHYLFSFSFIFIIIYKCNGFFIFVFFFYLWFACAASTNLCGCHICGWRTYAHLRIVSVILIFVYTIIIFSDFPSAHTVSCIRDRADRPLTQLFCNFTSYTLWQIFLLSCVVLCCGVCVCAVWCITGFLFPISYHKLIVSTEHSSILVFV